MVTNVASATLGGPGSLLHQRQPSGQVVAIPLPKNGFNSITVAFAESSSSPQPVEIEISITKCPGHIDTDYSNACNVKSSNGHYNAITSLTRPYSVVTSATTAKPYGLCWAGDGGDYYVNARWTYAGCRGGGICGFDIQHQRGPW